MDKPRGRTIRISTGRKFVAELLHHGQKVPAGTISRELKLDELAAVRGKTMWASLFAKGYALVAKDMPELRRNWLTWPWKRIYEHPVSEATIVVEREMEDGERIVLAAKLHGPENMSLAVIDGHIRRFREAPVREVSDFRQLLRHCAAPLLWRRFVFWSTLNVSGPKRCKRFGTFAVSSVGQFGANVLHPVMPLTAYLNYGPISPAGTVTAVLTFDHRVMDGRHAAQSLVDLERVMNSTLADELWQAANPDPAGANQTKAE